MARPEDVEEVNRITPMISEYLTTLQASHVCVLSALSIIIAKTIDECKPPVTIDAFCDTVKSFYSNKEHLELKNPAVPTSRNEGSSIRKVARITCNFARLPTLKQRFGECAHNACS
jgi:hypothetical protein